jgi:hypothetical protein
LLSISVSHLTTLRPSLFSPVTTLRVFITYGNSPFFSAADLIGRVMLMGEAFYGSLRLMIS